MDNAAAKSAAGETARAVSGVKDVKVLSDTESQWKVEARAGFMARTFDLRGTITDRRAPEYLAFAAQGQDLQIAGNLKLTQLGESLTRCTTTVDVTVTGPFAPIVDLMAKTQQQQLIRQTIGNLRKKLGEKAVSS